MLGELRGEELELGSGQVVSRSSSRWNVKSDKTHLSLTRILTQFNLEYPCSHKLGERFQSLLLSVVVLGLRCR
jgi:hypothetical protein